MEKLRERQARRKQPEAVTEPKVMPAPEEKKLAVGDSVHPLSGQLGDVTQALQAGQNFDEVAANPS